MIVPRKLAERLTQGWAFSGTPSVASNGTVTLVEGLTFCICEPTGDIRPGAEQGLFFRDTRFLSRFELTVESFLLDPLAALSPAPYAGIFVTRRPPRAGIGDSTLLVVRNRYVGNGMREDITVRNLGAETAGVGLMSGGRRRLRRFVRGEGGQGPKPGGIHAQHERFCRVRWATTTGPMVVASTCAEMPRRKPCREPDHMATGRRTTVGRNRERSGSVRCSTASRYHPVTDRDNP